MFLISPTRKQYKANLHCHSTISDGRKTPEELKELYKSNGYSVLAITDHEAPKKHTCLSDDDFLLITGYESYIRPSADCRYDPYDREVHLNLFARDPDNEGIINYNKTSCKYLPADQQEHMVKLGSQEQRQYTVEYLNRFIRTAKENGYIVAYNHHFWSMEGCEFAASLEGLFSMELCNYSSFVCSRMEYNGGLYNYMLNSGRRIACHSADDNHNKVPMDYPESDSFGAFAMIMPEEFTYSSVIDAMEKGEMYSSMGPLFREISLEGNRIHIECSPVEHIMVFTGSNKELCRVHSKNGDVLTQADFELRDSIRYVRVCVQDSKGRFADTRGYFRDELGF